MLCVGQKASCLTPGTMQLLRVTGKPAEVSPVARGVPVGYRPGAVSFRRGFWGWGCREPGQPSRHRVPPELGAWLNLQRWQEGKAEVTEAGPIVSKAVLLGQGTQQTEASVSQKEEHLLSQLGGVCLTVPGSAPPYLLYLDFVVLVAQSLSNNVSHCWPQLPTQTDTSHTVYEF